jgi:hypothetical protein
MPIQIQQIVGRHRWGEDRAEADRDPGIPWRDAPLQKLLVLSPHLICKDRDNYIAKTDDYDGTENGSIAILYHRGTNCCARLT